MTRSLALFLAVAAIFVVACRDQESLPNALPGLPSGHVGSVDYELTGEVVELADGRIVIASAAVRDQIAYLVYTRIREGGSAFARSALTISAAGEDHPATQLKIFELQGIEVGLLQFTLVPGPAEYRLGESGLLAPGTVAFRARNGAAGGSDLMNAMAIKGDAKYRTQFGERAAVGPDVFATAIDVVDPAGGKLGGTAISIDSSGIVTTISDDELAAMVKRHWR